MAVVLKQLNRSDEAIEAIKSFRHLCVPESQESIDNVLVELYKVTKLFTFPPLFIVQCSSVFILMIWFVYRGLEGWKKRLKCFRES
ncbi:Protein POLLENLESS 3 [Linum grandiflorum]